MPSSSTRRNGERAYSGRDYGQSILRDILALASTVVGSGKHVGAQKISAVAESTRTFGEGMAELPNLQAYADAAADALDEFAEYVDTTEVADILDDMGTLARRQPVMTAAAALAAGIVVTQVLRNWRSLSRTASSRARPRSRRRGNGRVTH
jgi:hypothetical protein